MRLEDRNVTVGTVVIVRTTEMMMRLSVVMLVGTNMVVVVTLKIVRTVVMSRQGNAGNVEGVSGGNDSMAIVTLESMTWS